MTQEKEVKAEVMEVISFLLEREIPFEVYYNNFLEGLFLVLKIEKDLENEILKELTERGFEYKHGTLVRYFKISERFLGDE